MVINTSNNTSFITELKFENSIKQTKQTFSVLFNEMQSKGVSINEQEKMVRLIHAGKKIALQLMDIKSCTHLEYSSENALALTWFLMACGFQEAQDTFARGTVRFTLSDKYSKEFKHYLMNCSGAHSRLASHFNDMKIGFHKGLDFGKGTLPVDSDLSTLLFNRLNDGSFYIKLEREALSFIKPIQSIKHLKNWISHLISGGGPQIIQGKKTRRETDGQEEVAQAFKSVIGAMSKIEGQDIKLKKEIHSHDRIFKMVNRVNELANETCFKGYSPHYKRLRDSIDRFNKVVSNIQHAKILSGNEVIVNINKYL